MATRKMPPFMGKETPSEEKKEMKIKKLSPAMYRAGEKAEGVHGKSGMMKPSKYARGGKVRYDEGGDVPEGGRFDADTYERARNSVLQKQIDEQFPAEKPKRRVSKPAGKSMESDKSKRFPSQGDAELARLQRIDKPLERVEPEAYMPPLRALRAGAIGAGMGASAMRRLFSPRGGQSEAAKVAAKSDDLPHSFGSGAPKPKPRAEAPSRRPTQDELDEMRMGGEGGGFRRGGKVAAKFAKGGSVGASRRADGVAQRGKTRGKFV